MSDVSPRYLDGFLAAVVGGNGKTSPRPPAPDARPGDEPSPRRLPAVLSTEEHIKRELHPLDSLPRLLDCASANQPPGADDQFRFRWFGLFYQGPQQDAFLLRLRLPGGRLRAYQLAGLAEIVQELAGGCAWCNAQGGLDLPGVPVRAAAEIVRRVEAIGLRTLLTGGDCVQAVRGGETEGLAADAPPAEIYPLVCALEQALLLDRQLADLPGSCEVILRAADDARTTGADAGSGSGVLVFRRGSSCDGASRYTLSVPRVGSLDVPLTAAQVVPTCLGLLRRWSESGERGDRLNAGLAEFCAGSGSNRLRGWVAELAGPAAEVSPASRAEPVVPGAAISGVAVPHGRLLSRTLVRLADVARAQGGDDVRLASGDLHIARTADPALANQALRDALGDR